ncbi:two-component system sensor histidine kinase NtrB [Carboxydothermus ferrireducens]|uniref:histidine kinase n=1 Tax=Carboxydothermus ferrireducens DSM 11255 TaxID=1119529 RepID=A0ABX2R7E0_9THEO|nr:ATP-binding protein [Carboxydothermus ferrireducens]NYE56840.1 two-component system sporulation sensor kinase A [Carboxydothermus ferrireducens DSM 11255]
MIFCFLVSFFFLLTLILVFNQKALFTLSIKNSKKSKILKKILSFNRLTYLYFTILDNSPNIIIAIDKNNKVIFLNRRAEEVFGITKEEILGKNYEMFFQKFGVLERSILMDSLKYRKTFEVENYPIEIKNCVKRFWGKSYPLFGPKGEISGAVLVLWDTKDKQILTRELINQEKFSVVKTIAAGTAHEIRNPLTTVKGFIQLLGQEKLNDPESKVFLNTVLQEINRIEKIISELLILGSDKGLKKTFFNLNYLIEKVVENFTPTAYLNNISIVKNLAKELPLFYGDEESLYLAITSILNNAFEALQKDGVIVIETFYEHGNNEIGLRIADNGPGIPEELRSKIFEPFFTTKPEGTGLGLAICYRTIEEHGGEIRVYNNETGGATFEITLPLPLENAHTQNSANCAG